MPRLDNAPAYIHASPGVLLAKAEDVVEREVERCTVFEAEEALQKAIPSFQYNELVLGRVVGRGGFCVVRELTEIRLLLSDSRGAAVEQASVTSRNSHKRDGGPSMSSFDSSYKSRRPDSADMSSRECLARSIWSKKGGKYVVKQIEPSFLQNDKVTYLRGIIDLALEKKFLASLSHPNVLPLRGLCRDSAFEKTNFFIVLDYLPETLPKRLNTWMQVKRTTKGVTGFITGSKQRTDDLMTERLFVAYDVAKAMDFLHSKRIIYRDLKPDNVGFDANGVTKLMDFGLARQLDKRERDKDSGLYKMTGLTGGIRYMAPEVGLHRLYNLKADIYSWSMLMWYIVALEPPMGLYTPKMFIQKVFRLGYRPATKDKWSPRIVELMKLSWSEDIYQRPSFREVMMELRKEVNTINPNAAATMEVMKEASFVDRR